MQTVIGLFENAHDAQQAVQELIKNGFSRENVDITVKGNKDYSTGYANGDAPGDNTLSGTSNTVSDSTAESYESGGVNTTGIYRDESKGNDSYGSENSHSESFGDKVSRFFKNLFGNDDDAANRYSHVATKTGCVVTVHAQSDDEAEEAADILDENGAVNVDDSASQYGYSGSENYSTPLSDTGESGDNESKSLNVIKEDVQVGKREIETGGVRLRSRIVERPVEEELRLREEKVTVEREPVDRPATATDLQNFKEGEIEMTERAEVADVRKEARVVETVKLSKDVNERKETVRETARDTQVDVENIDKDNVTGNTSL